MEFQVGDRVRIREWDDLVAEFGLDDDGDIKTPFDYFDAGMKCFCGRECIVEDFTLDHKTFWVLPLDKTDGLSWEEWYFSAAAIEPIPSFEPISKEDFLSIFD